VQVEKECLIHWTQLFKRREFLCTGYPIDLAIFSCCIACTGHGILLGAKSAFTFSGSGKRTCGVFPELSVIL